MSAFQSKSKPPKEFTEEEIITLKDCLTTEGSLELNTIRILYKQEKPSTI